jgi:hypothetical protein
LLFLSGKQLIAPFLAALRCILFVSLMKRALFLLATASIGAITWKNLNPKQQEAISSAVKSSRRKLANFIAPEEDLGDLTDRVDPGFLEALISEEIAEAEALDVDPGDRIDPEP